MATKLFLRNTTTNGITDTGDGILYDLSTSAGSSVDTTVTNTTASGTEIQATKTAGGSTVAWISGRAPSGGFTLTTSDISLWQVESNMNANIAGRYRVFKRAANGTITELGGGPFSDDVEMNTADREDTWAGNVTDTAFAEDDRILIRYYLTNSGTMASGHTGTMKFNAADAATGDSFFNIAETVSFKANEISIPLTGMSSAVSLGDVGFNVDKALTGNQITGALGSVVPSLEKALTGNQIASALGSVTYERINKFSASTFVVGSDVALSAYEGQINGLWTKHPDSSYSGGEYNIDAATDRVWQSATVAYYSAGIPASADYYAELEFFCASVIAQNIGPAVRMDTSANTMYTLRLRDGIDWQLRKILAGVQSTLVTATTDVPTVGQSKRGRICVRGSTIWAEIEGGTVLGPVTDTDITAAGRAGIRGAGAASASTGFHVRDFIGSNFNDVSIPLTGLSAAAGLGAVALSFDKEVTGNAASTALGSLAVDREQSLSGNQSNSALGSLSVDRSLALSGLESPVLQGTITFDLTIAVDGLQITSALGSVVYSEANDLIIALTGVSSTMALGAVGVDRSVALDGQQSDSALGAVSPEFSVALTGNAVSVDIGTVTVSMGIPLAGHSAPVELGSVSVESGIALSGVAISAQLGNVVPEFSRSLAGVQSDCALGEVALSRSNQLSGLSIPCEVGAVSFSVSMGLTGLSVQMQLGSVGFGTGETLRTLSGNSYVKLSTPGANISASLYNGQTSVRKKDGR